MAAPYTSQSISGYNDNPPPDDGSQTEANRVKWATFKTKLTDTVKTLAENINSAVVTAFTKIIGGGGVGSTGISYQVISTDQGKLIRATASGITVTTPDATDVDDPFIFSVLNQSTGTITLDGFGAQTVNGSASVTIPPNGGCTVWTDGTNWFAIGLTGTPIGKELQYGQIVNGTIQETNTGGAATFYLKTLAGNTPSADDPVLLCFRNATVGNGNYVYRAVTSAVTLDISLGSTLGTTNGVPFDVWLVLFDDAGTIRLGAINATPPGQQPATLAQVAPIGSSTAEGAAGGADSAKVFYTGTAVTSKAWLILGVAKYSSGLATAGNWNVSPTTIQLYGQGIPAPNTVTTANQGMTLIHQQTAASSATIDFNQTNSPSAFDGTYDALILIVSHAKPATDDVEAWLRVGTGAGPTYETTSYAWQSTGVNIGSAFAQPGSASDSKMVMTRNVATGDVGNAAGENFSAVIELMEPDTGGGDPTPFMWRSNYIASTGVFSFFYGGGGWQSGTALTAIRFLFESGNIASGNFALYGLRRTTS